MQIFNYTFDASERKITLTDFSTIRLDCIRVISNTTDNIMVFNFIDSNLSGSVSANVLTLAFDTTGMSDTDKLTIIYEDPDYYDNALKAAHVKQSENVAGQDDTNYLQATLDKPVASSTYSPLTYAPLTQVTKATVRATQGNVLSFYVTNDNAAVRYFQLHNKATDPAGTNAPLYSFKIPAGTADNPGVLSLGRDFFTTAGKNFSIGIGMAISTTFGAFTDSATNTEHIVVVHYV